MYRFLAHDIQMRHVQTFPVESSVIHQTDLFEAGTEIEVQLKEKGLNMIVNNRQEDNVQLVRRVSLLWEELVERSIDFGNKNLRRIDNFNKEMIKRLKL